MPLAYSNTSLPYLIRTVCTQNVGEPHLTQSAIGKQTPAWFADLVLHQSSNVTARRKPPFISGGTARAVFVVAIDEVKKCAQRAAIPEDDISTYISQAIIFVSNHLRISHIPWNKDPQQGHRPSNQVMHNVWVSLGSTSTAQPDLRQILLTRTESTHIRALRVSEKLINDDPSGDWSALSVRLQNFYSILHKSAPPIEFTIKNASLDTTTDPIRDVYNYVFNSYNGTRPLHQLALFSAFVFAGLAPNVYPPKDFQKPVPSSPSLLKSYIRRLDWVSRPPKKGASKRACFIVVATVFIIAYLDPASPLRNLLNTNPEAAGPWHSKHSKTAHVPILPFSNRSFFLGAKGLTPLALCRLGLAHPIASRIMSSARWSEDVSFLNDSQISAVHHDVLSARCASRPGSQAL